MMDESIEEIVRNEAKEIYIYFFKNYKKEKRAEKAHRRLRALYSDENYKPVIEKYTSINFYGDMHDIEPEVVEEFYRRAVKNYAGGH